MPWASREKGNHETQCAKAVLSRLQGRVLRGRIPVPFPARSSRPQSLRRVVVPRQAGRAGGGVSRVHGRLPLCPCHAARVFSHSLSPVFHALKAVFSPSRSKRWSPRPCAPGCPAAVPSAPLQTSRSPHATETVFSSKRGLGVSTSSATVLAGRPRSNCTSSPNRRPPRSASTSSPPPRPLSRHSCAQNASGRAVQSPSASVENAMPVPAFFTNDSRPSAAP